MDNKKDWIAVGSSDGIVVNSHFGRARKFYIYEISDDNIEFIELREVEPICHGGNHDESQLVRNIEKIADCKYLLVSKIGNGAAAVAEQYDIDPYEIPGEITESIEQLIKYRKVKQLFE